MEITKDVHQSKQSINMLSMVRFDAVTRNLDGTKRNHSRGKIPCLGYQRYNKEWPGTNQDNQEELERS